MDYLPWHNVTAFAMSLCSGCGSEGDTCPLNCVSRAFAEMHLQCSFAVTVVPLQISSWSLASKVVLAMFLVGFVLCCRFPPRFFHQQNAPMTTYKAGSARRRRFRSSRRKSRGHLCACASTTLRRVLAMIFVLACYITCIFYLLPLLVCGAVLCAWRHTANKFFIGLRLLDGQCRVVVRVSPTKI